MKLPVLALFERSLRLESRSWLMCWVRTGLMLLVLLLLIPLQTMARSGFVGAPGLRFLEELSWLNMLCITLAGLSYFASVITEEKEEMMLGLLRMTNLNPIAILLGKSTSRLVGALLLLMVQIPFVLLAVTLGGVGLLQITAIYGTLLAYLFFLSNLALLWSVIFRTTNFAATFTGVSLALLSFGPFWLRVLVTEAETEGWLTTSSGFGSHLMAFIEGWSRSTPGVRLGEIFRTGFTGPAMGLQVFTNIAFGIFLFLLAWLLFERCTREEKETAPARTIFSRRASRPSRIPAGLVGHRAVTWKDFTFIGGGKFGLLARFGLLALLIGLIHFIAMQSGARNLFTREFEGGVLIWTSLIMTAMSLAVDASRIFQEEVRWKTLSSLVTLPMSVQELAYRKVAASLATSLPLLSGLVIGVVIYPESVSDFFKGISREPVAVGMLVVTVLQYIMFLHLVCFLSLIVKRGALPLAFAIQYIGGMLVTTFMGIVFVIGTGGVSMMCVLLGFISAAGTLILHGAIGKRLVAVAAEA